MTDDAPWLVVGLGNPGREYAGNRHNVGFMVADLLGSRLGGKFGRHKRAVAEVAEGRLGFGGPKLILAKPLTFMNLAGAPVAALSQFFKVPVEHVIAVHDELDVPYGQVRAKRGGGEGGHNGLRSMSRSLGSKEYARVRVGIGRPPGRQDPADYVLSDFSGVERKELDFLVDRSADVVEAVVLEGVEWAQNKYHGS
ncbi:aminoacyl-tRNA hydrolase [Amorphoplanes digitatis]|uniref:Peptidyl-tRNA hydrolase n=1 Tax=Actinoplanes digitatis TaxID=1868 RepID=A0A7W7HS58_9ACTN|nr:aminoacyl-tRNA hydrolase [Actinoplanes digitatis]MBB4759796.1 PTH1 family peptidyl-tRNA hydrolase [Actinoplanes digitatis]BFE67745.1 aminoacyl-tRNA hydrolase [Actinoplanes digitatis]GID94403.1 peptidyl-tRNA hydrolase [Actinoplanes digitatis]